ncbi:hypothetical protein PsorP6_013272 [Peronosclerospora sorghi]|uniref:Uncharacterized protein n=1 Tax=Peronosclerospora sorghi TaxID=230839 RepID=A0ACC0WED5_9STRA|nr:hypothetical protein PsorP6_013272 [Peronosclerospora sorghi]
MTTPFAPPLSSTPPSSIAGSLPNAPETFRPEPWRENDSNGRYNTVTIETRGRNVETFRDQDSGQNPEKWVDDKQRERHRLLSSEIYPGYAQERAVGNGYNLATSKRLRWTSPPVMQPSLLPPNPVEDSCPSRIKFQLPDTSQVGSTGVGIGFAGLRKHGMETHVAPPRVPSRLDDMGVKDRKNEAQAGNDGVQEKKEKKRVRYLRDTDRHTIIQRIEKGEKQAALAREFGVTRAAICHIKKNRSEILSRYNMLLQSAQDMDRDVNLIETPGNKPMVHLHEARATSVLLLMTILRDHRSSNATFRRATDRLIMILLEEALAFMSTQKVEVITNSGHAYCGLEMCDPVCGVAIGAQGFPLLVLFHQMEPEALQGSIHIVMESVGKNLRTWRLDHINLPPNIVQHKIFLFTSTCSTGEAVCKAIEALCNVGCDKHNIYLVVLLIASDGLIAVSKRFPQVKIISGGIDAKVDPHSGRIIPGFGDFMSRYSGLQV